jgi:hypothetical protein
MAVAWTSDERRAVDETLHSFPASSGKCFEAAQEVLRTAQQRSPATSKGWKLKPRYGRFVVPKTAVGQRWFHHYTVEVEQHAVDALTGTSGTVWDAYLSTHWDYSTDLAVFEHDLQRED